MPQLPRPIQTDKERGSLRTADWPWVNPSVWLIALMQVNIGESGRDAYEEHRQDAG
jgi:hypothetical protein